MNVLEEIKKYRDEASTWRMTMKVEANEMDSKKENKMERLADFRAVRDIAVNINTNMRRLSDEFRYYTKDSDKDITIEYIESMERYVNMSVPEKLSKLSELIADLKDRYISYLEGVREVYNGEGQRGE
jgi:hypothetical protein